MPAGRVYTGFRGSRPDYPRGTLPGAYYTTIKDPWNRPVSGSSCKKPGSPGQAQGETEGREGGLGHGILPRRTGITVNGELLSSSGRSLPRYLHCGKIKPLQSRIAGVCDNSLACLEPSKMGEAPIMKPEGILWETYAAHGCRSFAGGRMPEAIVQISRSLPGIRHP